MQQFAFNFSDKFEFCCSPNVVYSFNQEISMFSNSVSLENGLKKLKDIFENKNIFCGFPIGVSMLPALAASV